MLVRLQGGATPSGATKQVCSEADCPADARRVMVAFGENAKHEFGHAFADWFDEYIQSRDMDARWFNPEPSVFLLWNVSFSNERCDLLWPHLAPGGRYNPNVCSPIGRLYMGGYCASNAWHSEYFCLMNGGHNNYQCAIAPNEPVGDLRLNELCFWCQEVVTVRILEKTGQFARAGDPSDVNDRGRTWYERWDTSLREGYYQYFDLPSLIASRNARYTVCAAQACSLVDVNGHTLTTPLCLGACDLVEYGNAIYVDSTLGRSTNSGSRNAPLDTLLHGITAANTRCASTPLVSIQPGSYRGAMTLSEPAMLVTDTYGSVVIGR